MKGKNLLSFSIIVFFLFGCQFITNKIDKTVDSFKSPNVVFESNNHHQFESRELITKSVNRKKIQVALFFPMSGKNKELGNHLLNSAMLSLFDNDLTNNIELVLFDSKDSLQDAKKSFQEIINKKIKIVIGPVFSQTISAIEDDAKNNKITVISLSNNQDLIGKTNQDGGIFLAGMMPETQVDKIVSYAISRGKLNFSIIAPNNQYGHTINDLLKKMVASRNGNFVSSNFYEQSDRDINQAVQKAINSFILSSRASKMKEKQSAIIPESEKTYPQVIMIPESGKNLSKIVSSIKRQNLEERSFQIIGTSQWDDINTLNDFNLFGSWFASPDNSKFKKFEKFYYQNFNKFPPRISSIVYDSIRAVTQIANSKNNQNITIKDFINYGSDKNGFEGIDGMFRFLPNGLVQRNLAVLQVSNGQFELLEKPLDKFLKY